MGDRQIRTSVGAGHVSMGSAPVRMYRSSHSTKPPERVVEGGRAARGAEEALVSPKMRLRGWIRLVNSTSDMALSPLPFEINAVWNSTPLQSNLRYCMETPPHGSKTCLHYYASHP